MGGNHTPTCSRFFCARRMSELDEKEQGKIVRHFLLNSPPGQFANVQRDIEKIVEVDGLVDRILPNASKRYNEEQLLVVSMPDDEDTKFLVSKAGAVQGGYYEPCSNKVVSYDHVSKAAGEVRDATDEEMTPGPVREHRDQLSKKFLAYVDNYYPDGVGVVYAKAQEDGTYQVTACLSGTKTSLGNRWSGRMRGTYTCALNMDEDDTQITGKITIKVHYFEEGNVQLNTTSKPELSCKGKNAEEFAETFVAAVEKSEQA